MLSSKWLYVAGQVMYTPLVLIFCWMAVHEFYSAEVTVGWSRGGKLPPAASPSSDIYLIALIAVCMWFGGLYKIVQMFRAEKSGD